jgi:hypothetical protein
MTMESLLQMTPLQFAIALAINIWMFVIFPIIVIRKLNYMTQILEAQYYRDETQDGSGNG